MSRTLESEKVDEDKKSFLHFTVQDRRIRHGEKISFHHLTMQDHRATPTHFLIPPVYGWVGNRHDNLERLSAGDRVRADQARAAHHSALSLNYGMDAPFSYKMIPVNYSESVAVAHQTPNLQEASYVSYCSHEAPKRCKQSVKIAIGLKPIWHKDAIVCYIDSTKKRFRSTTYYDPKMKPTKYGDTYYALPSRTVQSFVSFLDYNVDKKRKWYKSTLTLEPKIYSTNTVHNFEYIVEKARDSEEDQSMSSTDEDSGQEDDDNIAYYQKVDDYTSDMNMNIPSFSPSSSKQSTIVINGYHSRHRDLTPEMDNTNRVSCNGYLSDELCEV